MSDVVEFTSSVGHQLVFYKITSSGIKFEVKAPGNAAIGLSKHVGQEYDYLVALGVDQQSWIQQLDEQIKESAETPNILSRQEYRKFWITWNSNSICLEGEGHSNPIVACKCYASDVKYITFFVYAGRYQHPVYWKVQLPPVLALEKSITKTVPACKLHWVPIQENNPAPNDAEHTNIKLPNNALIGGYEKENLYIIRAKHRGSMTPGKFSPSKSSAYIAWGGNSHIKTKFEVLCGYDCTWVATTKDRIPIGAVAGGYSETIPHEKLYIGRAKYENHIIPGKVQPSHKTCYIAYDDKEIGVDNYEILVVPGENIFADDTLMVPHIDNPFIELENDIDEEDNDHLYYGDL